MDAQQSNPTMTAEAARSKGSALYPNHYAWFVFLSIMDFLLTSLILIHGGRELNWLADRVLHHHALEGLFAYKIFLVVLLILLMELIGRLRPTTGLRVAQTAVAITAVPVIIGYSQLLIHAMHL